MITRSLLKKARRCFESAQRYLESGRAENHRKAMVPSPLGKGKTSEALPQTDETCCATRRVRTASGSERIENEPLIETGRLHLIRSLPLAVLTPSAIHFGRGWPKLILGLKT